MFRTRIEAMRRTRIPAIGLSLLCFLVVAPQGAICSALAGTCELYPSGPDHPQIRGGYRAELLRRAAEDARLLALAAVESPAALALTARGRTPDTDPASRVPPGLAFLMSAVVPGTGQLAEGRKRAFLYLGVEALAWISHFAWIDAGNKKEGEYEAYARRHWDFDHWRDLAYDYGDSCRDALPDGVDAAKAEEVLAGHLESGDLQHYYEDIGKLEAYRAGWDDFSCVSPDDLSPHRREYRSMRVDSNDYLEKARFAATMAFLNRVISAVDAFRTAKGARLALSASTSVEFNVAGSIDRPRASVRIRRRW
jgi:hypothetical protein